MERNRPNIKFVKVGGKQSTRVGDQITVDGLSYLVIESDGLRSEMVRACGAFGPNICKNCNAMELVPLHKLKISNF